MIHGTITTLVLIVVILAVHGIIMRRKLRRFEEMVERQSRYSACCSNLATKAALDKNRAAHASVMTKLDELDSRDPDSGDQFSMEPRNLKLPPTEELPPVVLLVAAILSLL